MSEFYLNLQVQANSVWLREDFTGGMAFFPNDANTSFDLPTADPPMILVVEGNAQISESSTSNTTSTTTAVTPIAAVPATRPGNAAGPSTPAYRRPPMTCTVKIVKADFRRLRNGRVDFTPVGQLFVDLTDNSANVDHVLAAVQRHWGSDQTIVTADGLQIEDSAGTQGMMIHDDILQVSFLIVFPYRVQILEGGQPKNLLRM